MEPDLTDEELREITRRKREDIRQGQWPPEKIGNLVGGVLKEDYEEWKKATEKSRQWAKRRKARKEREKQRKDPERVKDRNRPRAKKREYQFDIMPRWIKHSELPGNLNQKHGGQAWPILSCLIESDCRFNPNGPDWFSQSYREIAKLTGTSLQTVRRVIDKLEKAGYLSVIRGEFKGLKSSFKISDPLPTPKGPNSIKAVNGGFLGRRGKEPNLRYWQRVTPGHPLDEKERVTNEISKGDI